MLLSQTQILASKHAFRKMIKPLFTLKTRSVNYAGTHRLCHAYFVESPSKALINLCVLQSRKSFQIQLGYSFT